MLAVPGAEGLMWRGAGRGWLRRFEASRAGRAREAQEAARKRLEAVGLLDVPPCLDDPPEPNELEG
jgi:hypothetical protein